MMSEQSDRFSWGMSHYGAERVTLATSDMSPGLAHQGDNAGSNRQLSSMSNKCLSLSIRKASLSNMSTKL